MYVIYTIRRNERVILARVLSCLPQSARIGTADVEIKVLLLRLQNYQISLLLKSEGSRNILCMFRLSEKNLLVFFFSIAATLKVQSAR